MMMGLAPGAAGGLVRLESSGGRSGEERRPKVVGSQHGCERAQRHLMRPQVACGGVRGIESC